ncbi:MAG: agmatinase [Oscillospiraceae bacterium]|nr:agmatinase [Oscillospiraceae bacterium]
MLNKSIITDRFIGCDSDYESADIVLFGAGFDGTTSYRPGTRFAGKVIRSESYGLETYSPYLERDLSDIKVFDSGELELPFGNTEKVLGIVKAGASDIVYDNKIPIMLGGEHLVTLPAVEACLEKYPDLHIIHFDAHTDLRDEYLGEKLSHACVMRRAWELVGDNKIHSFGIRSGTREEFKWSKERVFINGDFERDLGRDLGNTPVYMTIDLDVLDPSEFPATGTPEAGGWRFNYLRGMIKEFCVTMNMNIVGADLAEYSPPYDNNGVCAATAGKVLRELLLSVVSGKRGK